MSQLELPPGLGELLARQGLFQEKYRLKKLLGEGSFAFVIHAVHEAMDRQVALKFLRPDVLKAHPEVGKRFLLEVKLASRLTSPNTVTIFDFGETEEEIPFMVLEYVKGKTLDQAIGKYGPLGLRRSLELTQQILNSLEEAHALHIIHRDLKPANIMVGKTAATGKLTAKVLDFGVAKLVEKAEEKLKTSSGRQSTQFIGTPRYMSPEQILGQKVSAASDLYSLGLILYEMCTGEDSITESSVADVARIHLDDGPLPLLNLSELPTPLQGVILTATARRPADRYRDAMSFRQAIVSVIEEGRDRSTRAQERPRPVSRRPQRSSPQDVFSGKNYLDLPEDSEAGVVRSPSAAPGMRTLSPPAPQRSSSVPLVSQDVPAAQARLSTREKLSLDMDSARSVDVERRRQIRQRYESRKAEAETIPHAVPLWVGSVVALLLTTYLGVLLVGGAFGTLATPMRLMAGLLPVIFGFLWAVFAQNAFPDVLRRRVVPWAKKSPMMVGVSLVFVALMMPGTAASSLAAEGVWFAELLSQEEVPGVVAMPSQSLSGLLADLMDFADRILPWT